MKKKTGYAIIITKKLKSASAIRQVVNHNARRQETPNANQKLKNKNRIIIDGGSDPFKTVITKIENAGAKKKSNSVLAQEIILTASPKFYRLTSPEAGGKYSRKKLDQWVTSSVEWLQENFGKNIIDCRLHLDEMTPHLHAIVVPLTKDNRLCAKEIFNRKKCFEIQKTYPEKLKSLGLKRGIKGSKAHHTVIKKMYTAMNKSASLKIPEIPPPNVLLRKIEREQYAKRINDMLHAWFDPIVSRANIAEIARQNEKAYKKTAEGLMQNNDRLKKRLKQIEKKAIDSARSIPLDDILKKSGLELDMRDKKHWIGLGHRISFSKKKFKDYAQNKSGEGVIELIKHLNPDFEFYQTVAWIYKEMSQMDAIRTIRTESEQIVHNMTQGVDLSFQVPTISTEHTIPLKSFLKDDCKLDPNITDHLIQSGRIFATQIQGQTNAVFLCNNIEGVSGAEIMNIHSKFSSMATGSKRDAGTFNIGETASKTLVFVESALDALSYKELHANVGLISSTAGATVNPMWINKFIGTDWTIKIAFNDKYFGETIKKQHPKILVETPISESWNHDLQIEKDSWTESISMKNTLRL